MSFRFLIRFIIR